MPWGVAAAAVAAGGAIYSANKSADAQTDAAGQASGISRDQYYQQRADFDPYRMAGGNALNQLQVGTSGPNSRFMKRFGIEDFQADPGYKFRMDQGINALEGSAAARGGLLSGGTMKAINEYGQNFATNEYNNAYERYNADIGNQFNRLNSLSQTGLSAAAQTGNAGTNMANQVAANTIGAGNARAANYMAQGNAVNSALNNMTSMYAYDKGY